MAIASTHEVDVPCGDEATSSAALVCALLGWMLGSGCLGTCGAGPPEDPWDFRLGDAPIDVSPGDVPSDGDAFSDAADGAELGDTKEIVDLDVPPTDSSDADTTERCEGGRRFPGEVVRSGDNDGSEREPSLNWSTTLADATPHDEELWDYQEVVSLAFADDFDGRDNAPATLVARTANPDRPEDVDGVVRNLTWEFVDLRPFSSNGYSPSEEFVQTHGLPASQLVPARHTLLGPFAVTREETTEPNGSFVAVLNEVLRPEFRDLWYDLGEVPEEGEPRVGPTAIMPNGLLVTTWNDRRLMAIRLPPPERPDPEVPRVVDTAWSIETDDIWENAPSTARIDWLRAVGPETIVFRIRDQADDPVQDRLFELDPCRPEEATLIVEANGIGPEVVKTSDGFLLRVGHRDGGFAGSEPVHVVDGRVVARLGEQCRGLVQSGGNEFRCARGSAAHGELTWIRFSPTMDDPSVEGLDAGNVRRGQLHLVGQPGPSMLFTGVRRSDETASIVVLVRYSDGWRRLQIEATQTRLDADTPLPRVADTPGVLTPSGEFLFAAVAGGRHWIFGVNTALDGLVETSYPRARYGGNYNRGWVKPHPR